MSQTIDAVYRDFNTAGVPASGDHQPRKPEIRALLKMIQNAGGQAVTRNTLTALQAVTPPNENYMGVVLTGDGAGYYSRVGGAWVFGRAFADTAARLLTVGGTVNAITASVAAGVSQSNVVMLFLTPLGNNTGAATLAVSGETARPLVAFDGEPLQADYLIADATVPIYDNGTEYRLLFDHRWQVLAQRAEDAAEHSEEQADRSEAGANRSRDEADRAAGYAAGIVTGNPRDFKTVAALLVDTSLTYSGSTALTIDAGDIITAEGFRYGVAASGATDNHVATAGGVKLYVRADTEGAYVEAFGARGDNATNCTAAIWAAIRSLRRNPKDNIDTIGGNVITMYSSGRVIFGPGVYRIDKDALDITQDMGLTFVGAGSRGMTNALLGATTLLITGAGAGFGIRAWRGGARGLSFRNIDVCYEGNLFTGDLVDSMSAPHLSARDSYFGTIGTSGGTRHQSAQSLIRISYDEDTAIDRCVFDGAQRGVWFDDTRVDIGNVGFGGWGTKIKDSVFYDFTDTMVIQTNSGTRLRSNFSLDGCHFNPLNINPVRSLDLNIVRGLSMDSCFMGSSVSAAPSTEWARLNSVVGTVQNTRFGSNANGMTVGGLSAVDFKTNIMETIGLSYGFRVTGGSVGIKRNRFDGATTAILVQDDGSNFIRIEGGGDIFRSAVGTSININSATTLVSGAYDYEPDLDGSVSGFVNSAERVKIANRDGRSLAIATATATITKLMSGLEIRATGAADQTFTMANAVRGTRFTFFKPGTSKLTINAPVGHGFYTGAGAVKTKIELSASDRGGSVTLESYETAGWRISYEGTATLT